MRANSIPTAEGRVFENFEEAKEPIKTAIALYRDQGRVPRENWLLL